MNRRELIQAGALAAAASVAGGAQAKTGPRVATAMADRTPVKNPKGKFLDLATPVGNREAWARLLGNTDCKSTKYGWAQGVILGVRPGEAVRDLVGFTMLSCARLMPHESGSGYRKVLREVGLYTDLATGEIIEEWVNPYLNEKVRVVPIANDPFNHTITEFRPAPPSYGGLNRAAPAPKPLQLDWTRRGDTLNLYSSINLFYPSALQPAKWPRENGNPFNQVTETFLYQIDWDAMQDPKRTSVEYHGTWSRTTPWLPWMLMGPTPGHCAYQTFMGSVDSIDAIDPKTVAYVREKYPKYLEAPAKWEEPSLSSLEWYAREQTPAPLPADGKVPVAPAPQLPAWFKPQ